MTIQSRTRTRSLAVATALAGGLCVAAAQPPAPTVFSAAQAEAGRAAYENTCVKCHTVTLRGRTGDPSEMPPVSSLPADMQKMIQDRLGKVPPLAGPYFMARWGTRTTEDLSKRIQEAIGGFPPAGTNDTTALKITAYVLQVNGARPGTQELTATTAVPVDLVTRVRQ